MKDLREQPLHEQKIHPDYMWLNGDDLHDANVKVTGPRDYIEFFASNCLHCAELLINGMRLTRRRNAPHFDPHPNDNKSLFDL